MKSINNKFVIIAIFIIASIWVFTVFNNFRMVDRFDWDKFLAYQELQRKIIVEYRQFPFWNPYICGGEPWLAHPQSNFLSPFFLFTLVFGALKGVVVIYYFQVLVGLFGMYYLSKHFGLNKVLSLLNSVFLLNVFNLITFVNAFTALDISFLPWLYLFFNKSKGNSKYWSIISILLAYFIYSGAYYVFLISVLIIFVDGLIYTVLNKKLGLILFLVVSVMLAIGLAAPKFIPMMELIMQYPRYVAFQSPAGLFDFSKLFLFPRNIFFPGYENMKFAIWGVGTYFSLIFLSFFAAIFLWRKYKALVILNLFFLLLALGDNSPINLWYLWHFLLPSFKESRIFFLPEIMIISLLFGLLVENAKIRFLVHIKHKTFVDVFLLIVVSLYVFNSAHKIFERSNKELQYFNAKALKFSQKQGDSAKMYEAVRNNHGVVFGYDSIGNQIKTRVVPQEDVRYKGEYFLSHPDFGKIEQVLFSPNVLKFNVRINKDTTLIINQNYFIGWRCLDRSVVDYDGLIGVPLKTTDRSITVYYFPHHFVSGLVLSLLTLFLYVFFLRML